MTNRWKSVLCDEPVGIIGKFIPLPLERGIRKVTNVRLQDGNVFLGYTTPIHNIGYSFEVERFMWFGDSVFFVALIKTLIHMGVRIHRIQANPGHKIVCDRAGLINLPKFSKQIKISLVVIHNAYDVHKTLHLHDYQKKSVETTRINILNQDYSIQESRVLTYLETETIQRTNTFITEFAMQLVGKTTRLSKDLPFQSLNPNNKWTKGTYVTILDVKKEADTFLFYIKYEGDGTGVRVGLQEMLWISPMTLEIARDIADIGIRQMLLNLTQLRQHHVRDECVSQMDPEFQALANTFGLAKEAFIKLSYAFMSMKLHVEAFMKSTVGPMLDRLLSDSEPSVEHITLDKNPPSVDLTKGHWTKQVQTEETLPLFKFKPLSPTKIMKLLTAWANTREHPSDHGWLHPNQRYVAGMKQGWIKIYDNTYTYHKD